MPYTRRYDRQNNAVFYDYEWNEEVDDRILVYNTLEDLLNNHNHSYAAVDIPDKSVSFKAIELNGQIDSSGFALPAGTILMGLPGLMQFGYTPINGITWTQATSAAGWSARYGHTALVFNNKMWILGGLDGTNRNDVWYSSDGITWTQATSAAGWSARYGHTVLVFNNKMWVLGGYDGAYKNDVWALDCKYKYYEKV